MTLRACAKPLALVVATAVVVVVNAACATKSNPSAATDAGPAESVSVAAPAVSSVTSNPSAAPRPPVPSFECRAISVTAGKVKPVPLLGLPPADGGALAPVAEGGEISDDAWLDVDPGGKLTAKHPHSTREVVFTGPGRFRACVSHGEEAWLVKGTFNSVPSSGERPGGEEWLVTPAGVVRYAAANVEVMASPGKTDVKLSSGSAYVWTGDQAGPVKPAPAPIADAGDNDGWIRLDGARTITLTAKPVTPEASAQAGLDRCLAEAKTTKDLAALISSPDASLTQVAPRHVMARRVARAACAIAALRVNLAPPSPARDVMFASLRQGEMEWRSVRPRGFHGGRPPFPGRGPGGANSAK
jgi:hypothetical protein